MQLTLEEEEEGDQIKGSGEGEGEGRLRADERVRREDFPSAFREAQFCPHPDFSQ